MSWCISLKLLVCFFIIVHILLCIFTITERSNNPYDILLGWHIYIWHFKTIYLITKEKASFTDHYNLNRKYGRHEGVPFRSALNRSCHKEWSELTASNCSAFRICPCFQIKVKFSLNSFLERLNTACVQKHGNFLPIQNSFVSNLCTGVSLWAETFSELNRSLRFFLPSLSSFLFHKCQLALWTAGFLCPLLLPVLFILHRCYLHDTSAFLTSSWCLLSGGPTLTGKNECLCVLFI